MSSEQTVNKARKNVEQVRGMYYNNLGDYMDTKQYSNQVKLKNIKINDSFWSNIQSKISRSVIPYQYEALNDRIENAEKSYCIENFKKASRAVEARKNGEALPVYPTDKWHYDDNNANENAFHGWVFQDSDAYKWLEAVAYSLTNKWDDALYKNACEVIDLICSAQEPNGYLDTLYTINNPKNIFTNLHDYHELYCFGHLAEAGVAFYEATGNRRLLECAMLFADLICSTFNSNAKRGYPGHEIAEMALIKLYEASGKRQYLDTAEFFINERGTKPYYFDIEQGIKTDGNGYVYNQAHLPVKEQKDAVGHAVRGVYLYSGMADAARLLKDDELYSACQKIWQSITQKKMYITGGIGSTVDGEAFSFDYDLPNDLAYCETCASIGLIFFGMRMLKISPNSQIGDTIERALYNTVLAGMNEDGDRFFYVNPLEVLPKASKCDSRKHHVKTERQKWFGCACCPPNLARLLSSIGEYCITENNNVIYIHQYIGGEYRANNATVVVNSKYAENGQVSITISPKKETTVALRIPAWCKDYSFDKKARIANGYAYFDVSNEVTVNAHFNMSVRLVGCSNLVRENVGKLSVCRGPFVYCVEEIDNGADLQMLRIDADTQPIYDSKSGTVKAKGFRQRQNDELYFDFIKPAEDEQEIILIPYCKWGNRGENEMNVYIRY